MQLTIFLIAVAVLVPAVSPTEAMAGGLGIKLIFLGRIAMLLAIAYWMLRSRSLGWSDVGLNQPNWLRFAVATPTGILLILSFSALTHAIIVKIGVQAPDYSIFAPIKDNLGQYLYWLVPVSIGTAAFGEELIFRGFINDALRRMLGGSGVNALIAALTAQATIFGGLHFYQGFGGMMVAGVTGLALGLTWLIAGRNLWAGIFIHALFDGTAMTMIYLGYIRT